MPSVAEKKSSIEDYTSYFPLTFPIPTPTTHPDLITTKDLHREEDLLRNPTSFRAWWTAINSIRESYVSQSKIESTTSTSKLPEETIAILGPLASPLARLTLQRLTYIYEAALTQFPNSFKLWKSYLQTRMSFVLGKPVVKKRAGGKKKFPEMKEALEEVLEDGEEWETPLDPIVGWDEWKALIAVFERALMWIPKVCTRRHSSNEVAHTFVCFVAAAIMAHVPLCICSPPMSFGAVVHPCKTYFRPCSSNLAAFITLSHLDSISALG